MVMVDGVEVSLFEGDGLLVATQVSIITIIIAEMEKAPSVASALVLFFPQAVLIFVLFTCKTCHQLE